MPNRPNKQRTDIVLGSSPAPRASRPNKSRVGPPLFTGPLLGRRQRKVGLTYPALGAIFVSLSVAAVIGDDTLQPDEMIIVALTLVPAFGFGLALMLGPRLRRTWTRKADQQPDGER